MGPLPSARGPILLLELAAALGAGAQMDERDRLAGGGGEVGEPDAATAREPPIGAKRDPEHQERAEKGGQEDRDHRNVREVGVEALASRRSEREQHGEQESECRHEQQDRCR